LLDIRSTRFNSDLLDLVSFLVFRVFRGNGSKLCLACLMLLLKNIGSDDPHVLAG
jgi:hypothetical protein